MDEAQRGLDTDHRQRLAQVIGDFAASGGTVPFACHDEGFTATHRLLALPDGGVHPATA